MRKLLLFLLLAITVIVCILIFVPFGKADFVGYVYQVDKVNDQTIIIYENNGAGMNVLIHQGATRRSIGSKVKVYYKDEGINAVFPHQAKVRLWSAKQNNEEKKAVQILFHYFSSQYERNFYPEILKTTSNEQEWTIVVNERNMETIENSDQTHTYIVNTIDQTVVISDANDS